MKNYFFTTILEKLKWKSVQCINYQVTKFVYTLVLYYFWQLDLLAVMLKYLMSPYFSVLLVRLIKVSKFKEKKT